MPRKGINSTSVSGGAGGLKVVVHDEHSPDVSIDLFVADRHWTKNHHWLVLAPDITLALYCFTGAE